MVDFLFALIELFGYLKVYNLLRFRNHEAKCVYSVAVFAGGRPFCTQILPAQGRPIKHFWLQKTRDTWLPDGEDGILLRSLVFTQYRSVTDGRTDGYAVP